MKDDVVLKPNPAKIAVILNGCSEKRVRFILGFVSIVIGRLRDGTLKEYDWQRIADDLGILGKVSQIIDSFDLPEDEFYSRYPRLKVVEDESLHQ